MYWIQVYSSQCTLCKHSYLCIKIPFVKTNENHLVNGSVSSILLHHEFWRWANQKKSDCIYLLEENHIALAKREGRKCRWKKGARNGATGWKIKDRGPIKMIRLLFSLMSRAATATFSIHLANSLLDKVQSTSKRIKHWALMRKRHMRHLWMKPLGADSLIQSNVFSRHPLVFEKGVKTLKLGLNARPDPFIKPCMRALSDSKAFWLIRTLCVTSSALCHLCCFCVWKLN